MRQDNTSPNGTFITGLYLPEQSGFLILVFIPEVIETSNDVNNLS